VSPSLKGARRQTSVCNQPTFIADLETRMEIVIAIELIVGAVFVVGFWFKNPELKLSRRLSQQVLDSYDDQENDDARVHS
jgi:hypothetical protein